MQNEEIPQEPSVLQNPGAQEAAPPQPDDAAEHPDLVLDKDKAVAMNDASKISATAAANNRLNAANAVEAGKQHEAESFQKAADQDQQQADAIANRKADDYDRGVAVAKRMLEDKPAPSPGSQIEDEDKARAMAEYSKYSETEAANSRLKAVEAAAQGDVAATASAAQNAGLEQRLAETEALLAGKRYDEEAAANQPSSDQLAGV